jgi:lipopolysaccharide transport system permease protein
MRDFPATPIEMVASVWRNRGLIVALTKREVIGRYRGSFLGLFWSFVNPLLMLTVYTFVFSVIFKARWTAETESTTEFAIVLFAGLIVFNLFSECVSRAPTLVLANPNYVKKIVFPLEVLPLVALLSASYHALVSFVVWIGVYAVLFGMPHVTILLLPLVFVPFAFFIMGLSWALASLGVFLRDISQFIGILLTMVMFLSPIFYPASSLPEHYRELLYLNPLTPVVEMTRELLYWAIVPKLWMLSLYWVASIAIAWLGFAWFQKTRNGFADVL